MSSTGAGTLSIEEYLALETSSDLKHEYVLGQVYAGPARARTTTASR